MKLLTKIGPIITIIACVAALYFAGKLGKIRDDLRGDVATANASLASTQKTLSATTTDLDGSRVALRQSSNETLQVKAELAAAKVAVGEKDQQATELTGKIAGLEEQVKDAVTKLKAAEETMAKLNELTQSVQFADLKDLGSKLQGIQDENKMLGEKVAKLAEEKTQAVEELAKERATPSALRGHVALARSMWNFIVLDIGQSDHVRKDTPFLIYRDSQLVAKAKITIVNQTSSVAEILPQAPGVPKEGDLVIPGAL